MRTDGARLGRKRGIISLRLLAWGALDNEERRKQNKAKRVNRNFSSLVAGMATGQAEWAGVGGWFGLQFGRTGRALTGGARIAGGLYAHRLHTGCTKRRTG